MGRIPLYGPKCDHVNVLALSPYRESGTILNLFLDQELLVSKPVILCVDDDVYILKALSRLFRNASIDVVMAQGAAAALAVLANTQVNLVMSDYRMPGMSGTEFLAEVNRQYPDLTCLLLTANPAECVDEVEKLGVQVAGVVIKPWDGSVLLDILARLLSTKTLDVMEGVILTHCCPVKG